MKQDRTALQIAKLSQEGEQTLLRLARFREVLKTRINPTLDEGEPNLQERQQVMTLIQYLEHKLRSIDEALQQVKQGRYGFCERCGGPIDPARLEAVPETTLCFQCKRVVECQPGSRAMVAGLNSTR